METKIQGGGNDKHKSMERGGQGILGNYTIAGAFRVAHAPLLVTECCTVGGATQGLSCFSLQLRGQYK